VAPDQLVSDRDRSAVSTSAILRELLPHPVKTGVKAHLQSLMTVDAIGPGHRREPLTSLEAKRASCSINVI